MNNNHIHKIYFGYDLDTHELYSNNFTLDIIFDMYKDDKFKSKADRIRHYLLGFNNDAHRAKEYFDYVLDKNKIII